jgi:cytochrome c-type biogenesis protein CcmF
MFFGFAASSKYDAKQTVSLKRDHTVEALGYQLTYTGYRPIDGEKYAFNVRVEKDGKEFSVAPVMYFSSYNEGLMRNPDIVNLITKDFYLAPLSLEQPGASPNPEKSELRQGEARQFGSLGLAFLGVEKPAFIRAAIGAKTPLTLRLAYRMPGEPVGEIAVKSVRGSAQFDPVLLQERFRLLVSGVSEGADGTPVMALELTDLLAQSVSPGKASDADILVAEVSVKPFINLVWSGVIVLVVGFLVTIVRRSREARLKDQGSGGDGIEDNAPGERTIEGRAT